MVTVRFSHLPYQGQTIILNHDKALFSKVVGVEAQHLWLIHLCVEEIFHYYN